MLKIVVLLVLCTTLSVSEADKSGKIIGGEASARGRWPWILSLQQRVGLSFGHVCTAALISEDYALTAAHCVIVPAALGPYRVLAGAFDLREDDFEDAVRVEEIIRGPFQILQPGGPGDIAILRLERPVDLSSDFVSIGQLPPVGENFVGNENCVMTGWGRDDLASNDGSPILLELRERVFPNDVCQVEWSAFSSDFDGWVLDQHICVGLNDRTSGACHGDSGGPLNCDVTGNGDYVIAGVASWGSGQQCTDVASMYVQTDYWRDFIEENVPNLP